MAELIFIVCNGVAREHFTRHLCALLHFISDKKCRAQNSSKASIREARNRRLYGNSEMHIYRGIEREKLQIKIPSCIRLYLLLRKTIALESAANVLYFAAGYRRM